MTFSGGVVVGLFIGVFIGLVTMWLMALKKYRDI